MPINRAFQKETFLFVHAFTGDTKRVGNSSHLLQLSLSVVLYIDFFRPSLFFLGRLRRQLQ